MEGEVIAAGPGARDERGQIVALEVKAGDRVLFGKWSGTEVKLDGEELLIMKESDIMGIVEERPGREEKGRVSSPYHRFQGRDKQNGSERRSGSAVMLAHRMLRGVDILADA